MTETAESSQEQANCHTEPAIQDFNDPRVAGQIRCIYADPPWRYGDQGCHGGLKFEYPTMSLEEIGNVPVWKLGHQDGVHLWLWTTWPMIRDGAPHRILREWGFRWVGEIIWVKPGLGVGRWLRPSTEILILAVCEKNPPLKRKNQKGHIEAKREGHSVKPDVFYETIESLSPGPYIELFARRPRDNWFRWGNQA
jgi:N6-adenosine-specific RNA methylase IME4